MQLVSGLFLSNITYMVSKEQKEKYSKYLKSKEWHELKIDLIQIRGCKCEKCNIKPAPNKLHVHHISYDRLYNEELNDLMLLCANCHRKEHGINKRAKVKNKIKPKRGRKKSPSIDYLKHRYEYQLNRLNKKLKLKTINKEEYNFSKKGIDIWISNQMKIHHNV